MATNFYLKVSGTPGVRGFATTDEAEREASKLFTEANIGKTITIERVAGGIYKEYRHTMGDDGYSMWHNVTDS